MQKQLSQRGYIIPRCHSVYYCHCFSKALICVCDHALDRALLSEFRFIWLIGLFIKLLRQEFPCGVLTIA